MTTAGSANSCVRRQATGRPRLPARPLRGTDLCAHPTCCAADRSVSALLLLSFPGECRCCLPLLLCRRRLLLLSLSPDLVRPSEPLEPSIVPAAEGSQSSNQGPDQRPGAAMCGCSSMEQGALRAGAPMLSTG